MRTFTQFSTAMAAVVLFLFILVSCSDKDKDVMPAVQPAADNTFDEKVSDEVKAQFVNLGFDVSDIKLIAGDDPLSGKSGKENYLLEGDIVITPENLQAMLGSSIHHNGAV